MEWARLRRVQNPAGARPERDAAQARDDVDDRTVDHAALAAAPGGEHRAHDAEGEAERPAPVAEDRRRRDRRLAPARGERQHAAQREIVEIVARGLGERAVLPPAGHAAIDEPRIALRAFGGAEPQALHHARPIALDQRVGRLDERHRLLGRFRELEVEDDDPLAAAQGIVGESAVRIAERRLDRATDRDNLGAEVCEHAAGERPRTDALELDDAASPQADESLKGPWARIPARATIRRRPFQHRAAAQA